MMKTGTRISRVLENRNTIMCMWFFLKESLKQQKKKKTTTRNMATPCSHCGDTRHVMYQTECLVCHKLLCKQCLTKDNQCICCPSTWKEHCFDCKSLVHHSSMTLCMEFKCDRQICKVCANKYRGICYACVSTRVKYSELRAECKLVD